MSVEESESRGVGEKRILFFDSSILRLLGS